MPFCPSSVRYTSVSFMRMISMFSSSGTTSGRCVSVCGQIGAMITPRIVGYMIGPFAASAYAVEPVGVATMTPSAL